MRPSHRLDLILVSEDVERVPDADAFEIVRERWAREGRLVRDGPGLILDGLVRGGFRRLWLDKPNQIMLYANHQGGYYVRCPITGGNLARPFSEAVQRWRAGGARSLECPHCGQVHRLEAIHLAPPGAFARGAVIFTDVHSLDLADDVQGALQAVLGPNRVIPKRVG